MSANLPTTGPANNSPLIRASELSQYGFCHRAWWLSTVKQVSSNHQAALIRGTRIHRNHTDQVRAALRWRQASFFLLGGGGLLLSVALLWYLFQ